MYRGNFTKYAHPRPVIECGRCGDQLFVPEWSEYLDERRVRHLWNCEACGHSFETTVHFPAIASQNEMSATGQ